MKSINISEANTGNFVTSYIYIMTVDKDVTRTNKLEKTQNKNKMKLDKFCPNATIHKQNNQMKFRKVGD